MEKTLKHKTEILKKKIIGECFIERNYNAVIAEIKMLTGRDVLYIDHDALWKDLAVLRKKHGKSITPTLSVDEEQRIIQFQKKFATISEDILRRYAKEWNDMILQEKEHIQCSEKSIQCSGCNKMVCVHLQDYVCSSRPVCQWCDRYGQPNPFNPINRSAMLPKTELCEELCEQLDNPNCFYLSKKHKRYNNGKISCIYTTIDEKINGKFTSYHTNGVISEIYNFTNDIENGPYNSFYNDGSQHEVFNFVDGNEHGEYIEYHQNGIIKTQCLYDNGKLNGIYKIYNGDGLLIEVRNYIQGCIKLDEFKECKYIYQQHTDDYEKGQQYRKKCIIDSEFCQDCINPTFIDGIKVKYVYI